MFGFLKHDTQLSCSHPWMQARSSTCSHSPKQAPKNPQNHWCLPLSSMPLPLFWAGTLPDLCQNHPAPWYLLVDPQQEIFMPEDSTFAPLPSAGAILDSWGGLLCGAWSLHVAAVMLDTAITGSSSPFWNFGWREQLLGAMPASFITSHPWIPTASQCFWSHCHFPWQMQHLALKTNSLLLTLPKDNAISFWFSFFS